MILQKESAYFEVKVFVCNNFKLCFNIVIIRWMLSSEDYKKWKVLKMHQLNL